MSGATDWRGRVLRGLYTGLLYLALPLALLRLYWRGRADPGHRRALDRAVRLWAALATGWLLVGSCRVGRGNPRRPAADPRPAGSLSDNAAAGDDHHLDRFPSSPGGAGRSSPTRLRALRPTRRRAEVFTANPAEVGGDHGNRIVAQPAASMRHHRRTGPGRQRPTVGAIGARLRQDSPTDGSRCCATPP
jgi:hypothetical protein